MVTLDEVKALMEDHLRQETDVMNKMLLLNEQDHEIIVDWYISHPLRKSLGKLYKNVDSRRLGHSETKDDGAEFMEQAN